ncbi:hypothetical protein D3C87_1612350 [compost metagenome]
MISMKTVLIETTIDRNDVAFSQFIFAREAMYYLLIYRNAQGVRVTMISFKRGLAAIVFNEFKSKFVNRQCGHTRL